MRLKPATLDAYQLLHQGSLALAQVEANGVKVDTDYLDRAMKKADRKINRIEKELKEDEVYRTWKKRFGDRTKIGSLTQLAEVIFGIMKYPTENFTATGKYKADEDAFLDVDLPFVKKYFEAKKWRNDKSTFLGGILKHVEEDGFLHPSYNLHFVKTYRSSSDKPNFQNYPIRNEDRASLIRRAFVPRGEDYLIGEVDFSGAEVKVAAFYNKDPTLISYVKDPTKDMHRDQAMECYKLTKEQVSKNTRYCAKNMFVFPEFYGSYYRDCSRNLWEAIDRMSLAYPDGSIGLREHLQKNGIRSPGKFDGNPSPGTFEYHIKQVEERFWKKFHVYAEWKKQWEKDYYKNGGYQLLSGFVVNGIYKRNEIINGAVQGTSFHCLLWTLIQFQKWLTKYKMKTRIVGQIHDSIVPDFHKRELEDCLAIIHHIVTVQLPKHWPWIIVPMEIEAEIAPEGKSWFDKEKVHPIIAPAGKTRLDWSSKEERWMWK